METWAKLKPPGYGPQVLVFSICQGKPFWGCPIFDPPHSNGTPKKITGFRCSKFKAWVTLHRHLPGIGSYSPIAMWWGKVYGGWSCGAAFFYMCTESGKRRGSDARKSTEGDAVFDCPGAGMARCSGNRFCNHLSKSNLLALRRTRGALAALSVSPYLNSLLLISSASHFPVGSSLDFLA